MARLRVLLTLLVALPAEGLRLPLLSTYSSALQSDNWRFPVQPRAGRALASEVDGEEEIGGAVLNEELYVTVQYLGGAASRQRRVRRTRRPPPEERWRLSAEPAGYLRMSAFCNSSTISLQESIDLIASNVGFRRFGERVAITSYTDVVHCRFTTPPLSDSEQPVVRDAFLFPCEITRASNAAVHNMWQHMPHRVLRS